MTKGPMGNTTAPIADAIIAAVREDRISDAVDLVNDAGTILGATGLQHIVLHIAHVAAVDHVR